MPKIPKFKNLDDEREFWDTHDTTDYIDDLEEVKDVRFVRPPKTVMTLRVEKSVVDVLKRMAKRSGIRYTSLARLWLVERLAKEARSSMTNRKRSSARKLA